MKHQSSNVSISRRRAFLHSGALILAATSHGSRLAAANSASTVKAGLITDLHYADKAAAGSRHYRETPQKLAEAGEIFRREQPDFIVELGDFIDAADSIETELGYLDRINRDFKAMCSKRHYVLGNHCVHSLHKQEFLDRVEQPQSYYSFDTGHVHFVVLDSCFRSDGQPYGRKNFEWTDPNIPDAELKWLKADLMATSRPTIVFAHQRLDVSNHYGVKNATAVRQILEASQQVLAVFQGHSHQNDYHDISGIHYCTLAAMVEGRGSASNGYSMMTIDANNTITINGFRRQASYTW